MFFLFFSLCSFVWIARKMKWAFVIVFLIPSCRFALICWVGKFTFANIFTIRTVIRLNLCVFTFHKFSCHSCDNCGYILRLNYVFQFKNRDFFSTIFCWWLMFCYTVTLSSHIHEYIMTKRKIVQIQAHKYKSSFHTNTLRVRLYNNNNEMNVSLQNSSISFFAVCIYIFYSHWHWFR